MLSLFARLLLISSLVILNTAYANNFADRPDVKSFILMMVHKHKFKKPKLIALFNQVKLREQVIRHINKPLEKQPWHTYQMLFVNEWRIQHGVKFWQKYKTTLQKAEKKYGVPASIIVATIGIETKYGQRIGGYRVIDSLSTLGFSDSPRAKFFRKELEEFLLLTRENKLDPLKVLGSYAGAIGQPQFMPSSYRKYAVDFSGSGKIDLVNNEIDVIGSIANYYQKYGWKTNKLVATQVYVVGDRYHYLSRKNKIILPLSFAQLAKYGIVPVNKLNEDKQAQVKIIELQNSFSKEYWLGFHNFEVIKHYNSSDAYAMAVFQLSNYIQALRERLHGD